MKLYLRVKYGEVCKKQFSLSVKNYFKGMKLSL